MCLLLCDDVIINILIDLCLYAVPLTWPLSSNTNTRVRRTPRDQMEDISFMHRFYNCIKTVSIHKLFVLDVSHL
jgi:hypothetical protein